MSPKLPLLQQCSWLTSFTSPPTIGSIGGQHKSSSIVPDAILFKLVKVKIAVWLCKKGYSSNWFTLEWSTLWNQCLKLDLLTAYSSITIMCSSYNFVTSSVVYYHTCRCFVWDDFVVVGGTEAGNAVIIQLHPSPKMLTTFGKSSGMYLTLIIVLLQ